MNCSQKMVWMFLGLNLYVNSMQHSVQQYDNQKTEKLKLILSECYNQYIFYSNSIKKHTEEIKELICDGADPNVVASGMIYRDTTLLEVLASYANYNDFISFLLENGASSISKQSALMNASRYGQMRAAKTLISSGADVNYKDSTNATALLWAVQGSYWVVGAQMVQLLLEKGAAKSINIPCDLLVWFDGQKKSPLTYARLKGYAEHYPRAREEIRTLLELYNKK